MAKGGFIISNIAATKTPVATSATAGYGVTNATDGVPSTLWKSAGALATETITWDFTSTVTLTGAALINHTIPATATSIKVQFSSDNFAHVHAEFPFTWRALNMYVTFAATTYQYVRIEIVMLGATTIQIGEVYLGTKWALTKDYGPTYRRIWRVNKLASIVGGQAFQDSISEQTGFSLPFRHVLHSSEWPYLQELLRPGYSVFVPDYTSGECYHIFVSQTDLEAEEFLDVAGAARDAFTLQVWENPVVTV